LHHHQTLCACLLPGSRPEMRRMPLKPPRHIRMLVSPSPLLSIQLHLPPVLTRCVLDQAAMISRRGVCAPTRVCLSHLCGPKPPPASRWLADIKCEISNHLDQHSTQSADISHSINRFALLRKQGNLKESQNLGGRVPLPPKPVPVSHEEARSFRYIKPQFPSP
jgi:hypothetical protein